MITISLYKPPTFINNITTDFIRKFMVIWQIQEVHTANFCLKAQMFSLAISIFHCFLEVTDSYCSFSKNVCQILKSE